MNLLFWGLLFCLLDFEITLGSAVFGLLPDFVGYFLLMRGMTRLAEESSAFDKGRHWAFGLLLVSAILYGADLMDPDPMAKVMLWVLGLCELIVMLMLVRKIISGVGQLEQDHSWQLGSEKLRGMWLILAVIQPLCHLVSWIPLVGSICSVASGVTGLLFLIAFWGSRKSFYGYAS